MDESMVDQDTLLDDWLDSVPLAPLPSGFVSRVMAQVQTVPQAVRPPRFRLEFLDWALPVFTALFALLLMLIWRPLAPAAARLFLDDNPLTAVAAGQVPDLLLVIGLLVLAELFLAGVVGVWLWADRPGYGVEG